MPKAFRLRLDAERLEKEHLRDGGCSFLDYLTKMSQSAQDETRTHTTLLPLPPQSSVYTNFTTCAAPR